VLVLLCSGALVLRVFFGLALVVPVCLEAPYAFFNKVLLTYQKKKNIILPASSCLSLFFPSKIPKGIYIF